MSGIALLWFAGMALVFAGERLFPHGGLHWPLTGLGVLLVLASIGRRWIAASAESDPGRRRAQVQAFAWSAVGAASLALYATTTQGFADAVGFDEDAHARWYGVITSLFAIVWLLGAAPMFVLDRALAANPRVLPERAARRGAESGLVTALAISLVFPVNFLASAHGWEWDLAYFRTTRAGASTLALTRTLPNPVQATLFFTPGSDVKEQVTPYFDTLKSASDGLFDYTVVDQALAPDLAEELGVRANGYVAFQANGAVQKFKVGTELDRAERELKKLDGTVQKHLLQLARGKRTAYLLAGHGEASPRERDDPMRKLNLFKRILESQNYKVQDLSAADGSAEAIPDDAALLVIAAPQKPLLPEEERAIGEYLDGGGRLLLLAEAVTNPSEGEEPQPLAGVLDRLGLQVGAHPVAHERNFIQRRRGDTADRVFLVSNRFGSHEAVTTLSRNSRQLYVALPTAAPVTKREGDAPAKITTLVRSFPDSWVDVDGDRMPGDAEPRQVFDLAVAAEGKGEAPFRAIVVGDVSLMADAILQFSQGNAQLAVDSLRWLVGDEDLAGGIENEEDVRIQHTRDEDVAWFYGTIFAVPMLVLVGGLVVTRRRRKS